jgi:hypothetical protein
MIRTLPKVIRISLILFVAFVLGAIACDADPKVVAKAYYAYMLWAAGLSAVFVAGTILGKRKNDE